MVRGVCLVVYFDRQLISSHSTLLRVTPHRHKVSLLDTLPVGDEGKRVQEEGKGIDVDQSTIRQRQCLLARDLDFLVHTIATAGMRCVRGQEVEGGMARRRLAKGSLRVDKGQSRALMKSRVTDDGRLRILIRPHPLSTTTFSSWEACHPRADNVADHLAFPLNALLGNHKLCIDLHVGTTHHAIPRFSHTSSSKQQTQSVVLVI